MRTMLKPALVCLDSSTWGLLSRDVGRDGAASWVVGKEIDRAMKAHLPKAEGSSLVDKFIAQFGLYVDAIEMDKRVWESVRQASARHPLLREMAKRSFRRKSWGELVKVLEAISQPRSSLA